ncbi:MAG: 50S ribosomal protein L24 [Nitrospirae bacterium GWC2_57_13]|jgi:large subunit ribosomal protein L24|nr:MAG: 50S ribosomal protein L24 [Nitrospirae bacterium GWC1_57_7]OGW28834.1 MAG: 50S ribosomal protein L24 [Nitrospirae bacterium GWC2_57_13]OGW44620.1 MAG: 50S ribosomal protein L24 [Nitrospirae bacterium GWD2_57_8]HAR46705.1 50S ribosomal protein L24 [Nitrospiraceae bacterium]
MQIKKNDTVEVKAGRERGKRGRVIAVHPSENRIVVEKLNIIKRHTRPNQQMRQGGIVQKEGPLSAANVMLVCPKCDKPTKTTRKANEGSARTGRVCRTCNEALD